MVTVGKSRVRDLREKRICYNGCGRTDLKKNYMHGLSASFPCSPVASVASCIVSSLARNRNAPEM
jgi:hypothetical protein